jgi:hypothetical protein
MERQEKGREPKTPGTTTGSSGITPRDITRQTLSYETGGNVVLDTEIGQKQSTHTGQSRPWWKMPL